MNEQLNKEITSLNSLVDKELEQTERDDILSQIEQDARLRNDLSDLYHLKEMVKSAYPYETSYITGNTSSRFGTSGSIAAGLLLLATVFVGGFQTGNHLAYTPEDVFHLSQAESDPLKVMLYIASGEDHKFRKTLSEAQTYLETYHDKGATLAVVTSSEGINLLRKSMSPYIDEIDSLKSRYGDAIDFIACNNTILKMKELGASVDIVNSADISSSAVQYVVDRLKEGWTYVAI